LICPLLVSKVGFGRREKTRNLMPQDLLPFADRSHRELAPLLHAFEAVPDVGAPMGLQVSVDVLGGVCPA
jgi:hypothetical protein